MVFNHYAPARERAFRRHLAAFPGCRGLAITHGGAVQIAPATLAIGVLRHGVTGTAHLLLAGPDEALIPIDG